MTSNGIAITSMVSAVSTGGWATATCTTGSAVSYTCGGQSSSGFMNATQAWCQAIGFTTAIATVFCR